MKINNTNRKIYVKLGGMPIAEMGPNRRKGGQNRGPGLDTSIFDLSP
jgi:hypothetical protein